MVVSVRQLEVPQPPCPSRRGLHPPEVEEGLGAPPAQPHATSPVPLPRARAPEPQQEAQEVPQDASLDKYYASLFSRSSKDSLEGAAIEGSAGPLSSLDTHAATSRQASQRILQLSAEYDALDTQHERLVDEYARISVQPRHTHHAGATHRSQASPHTTAVSLHSSVVSEQSGLNLSGLANERHGHLLQQPISDPLVQHSSLQDLTIRYKATISELREELREKTSEADALRAEVHSASSRERAANRECVGVREERDRLESEVTRVKTLSFNEQKLLKREKEALEEALEQKSSEAFEMREAIEDLREQLSKSEAAWRDTAQREIQEARSALEAESLQRSESLIASSRAESEQHTQQLEQQVQRLQAELKREVEKARLRSIFDPSPPARGAVPEGGGGGGGGGAASPSSQTAALFKMQEASLQQDSVLVSLQDEVASLKARLSASGSEKDALMRKLVEERSKPPPLPPPPHACPAPTHPAPHHHHHRGFLSRPPPPASAAAVATQTDPAQPASSDFPCDPNPPAVGLPGEADLPDLTDFSAAFQEAMATLAAVALHHGSGGGGGAAGCAADPPVQPVHLVAALFEGLPEGIGAAAEQHREEVPCGVLLRAVRDSCAIADLKVLIASYSRRAVGYQTGMARAKSAVVWLRDLLQAKINSEIHRLSRERKVQSEQQRAFELQCSGSVGGIGSGGYAICGGSAVRGASLSTTPTRSTTTSSSLPLVSAATSALERRTPLTLRGDSATCEDRLTPPDVDKTSATCPQQGLGLAGGETALQRKIRELEDYHNHLHESRIKRGGVPGAAPVVGRRASDSEGSCNSSSISSFGRDLFGGEGGGGGGVTGALSGALRDHLAQFERVDLQGGGRELRGASSSRSRSGSAAQSRSARTLPVPVDDRIMCLNAFCPPGRDAHPKSYPPPGPSGRVGHAPPPADGTPLAAVCSLV